MASVNVSFVNNVKSLSESPEIGVCFSSTVTSPTYADEHKRLASSVGSYNFTLNELKPETNYYYRAYVKLGDDVFYGNVKSIMTIKPSTPTYTLINGHKFVDLGLPSGLLWAEANVGASSATDDGDYFSWAETAPKSYYDVSTYKWGQQWSKYNLSDEKYTLDPEDDAATVNWGAPCRMPDTSDFQELRKNCDWSLMSKDDGTSGFLVTGHNGNSIFFPISGRRYRESLYFHDLQGFYWSRSLKSGDIYFVLFLHFTKGGNIMPADGNSDRYFGYPVRPVAVKK